MCQYVLCVCVFCTSLITCFSYLFYSCKYIFFKLKNNIRICSFQSAFSIIEHSVESNKNAIFSFSFIYDVPCVYILIAIVFLFLVFMPTIIVFNLSFSFNILPHGWFRPLFSIAFVVYFTFCYCCYLSKWIFFILEDVNLKYCQSSMTLETRIIIFFNNYFIIFHFVLSAQVLCIFYVIFFTIFLEQSNYNL